MLGLEATGQWCDWLVAYHLALLSLGVHEEIKKQSKSERVRLESWLPTLFFFHELYLLRDTTIETKDIQ